MSESFEDEITEIPSSRGSFRRRRWVLVTGIIGVVAIAGPFSIPQLAHATQVNKHRATSEKVDSLQTRPSEAQAKLNAATALSQLQYAEASTLVTKVDALGAAPKKSAARDAASAELQDEVEKLREDNNQGGDIPKATVPDSYLSMDETEAVKATPEATKAVASDPAALVAVLSNYVAAQTAARQAQQTEDAEAAAQATGEDGYVDPNTGTWVPNGGGSGDDNSDEGQSGVEDGSGSGNHSSDDSGGQGRAEDHTSDSGPDDGSDNDSADSSEQESPEDSPSTEVESDG